MLDQPVWKRALFPVGIAATIIGTLDPLEGSILIVLGVGLIALDAFLRHSRNRPLLAWSFAMAVCGVAAMWVLSSLGGIQMRDDGQGVSKWWALLILPYPAGWLFSVIAIFRTVWDRRSGGPAPLAGV
jgi:hypothetical protein